MFPQQLTDVIHENYCNCNTLLTVIWHFVSVNSGIYISCSHNQQRVLAGNWTVLDCHVPNENTCSISTQEITYTQSDEDGNMSQIHRCLWQLFATHLQQSQYGSNTDIYISFRKRQQQFDVSEHLCVFIAHSKNDKFKERGKQTHTHKLKYKHIMMLVTKWIQALWCYWHSESRCVCLFTIEPSSYAQMLTRISVISSVEKVGWLLFISSLIAQALGPVSTSVETSYCQIPQSLEAARFVFKIERSPWNLTGTSAAPLPMCLSNCKAIRTFQRSISCLRDFVRSHDKTSYQILKRGPGCCLGMTKRIATLNVFKTKTPCRAKILELTPWPPKFKQPHSFCRCNKNFLLKPLCFHDQANYETRYRLFMIHIKLFLRYPELCSRIITQTDRCGLW